MFESVMRRIDDQAMYICTYIIRLDLNGEERRIEELGSLGGLAWQTADDDGTAMILQRENY